MAKRVSALAAHQRRQFTFAVRGGVEEVEKEDDKVVYRWGKYPQLLRYEKGQRKIGRQEQTSLIEEFANCPPEKILWFTREYGPLTEAFSSGRKSEFKCDEWLQTQQEFRNKWESRMQQGRKIALVAANDEHVDVQAGETLVFGWDDELLYEAATVERVLLLGLYSQPRRRLRKCLRPGCENPYFQSNRPKRKFCSDLCASHAQREAKRKWWQKEGAEQRRKRATKGKRKTPK